MRWRQVHLALWIAASSAAQVNTGSLTGTVTDPTGSVIIGAQVGIRNTATGSSEAHLSNEDGIYRAPFLRPGVYAVRVEAKGFKTGETSHVSILIGKETALNVGLEVGSVSESITVDGAAPLIEATTAQASVNFDSRIVHAVPRLNAGIDRIALLAPGVAPARATTTSNGATLAVNGQRRRANNFLIDGQDNNHMGFAGPSLHFNNVDVIAEYQIVTNQFSAEYGKSQGAIVNITTRGGTNTVAGTGTWLHQNDAALGALTNFQRRAGVVTPPKAIDNLFGATLGGPVRKNKAFFFAYFNRQMVRRDTRLEALPSALTPTAAGLRALEQAFPQSNTVKVLLNQGPLLRPEGNPQFVAGSQRTDTVRGPGGQPVSVEMGRLVRSLRRPVDAWDFGARSDWNLGAKDRINARYLYRDRLGEKDIANIGGYSSDFYTEYHNSGVSWIRLITPETTNEARFGFGRENVSWSGADGSPFSDIGRNIAVFSMPAGYLGFGTAANFPQDASSRSLEIQDNLSRQAGRHGLRVGGHYWRGNARVATRRLYNGQFQFDTFQDFIDNRPAAFTGAAGDLVTNLAAQSMSVYFQDDLRLTSNLTLNLGVRYEFATQPAASLHDFTLARESNPATALWDLSLPLSSRTVPLPPVDRNNWAPRVGFAWSPRFASWMFGNEATVIRGGYSTSYELPYLFQSISVSGSAPVGKRYTLPGARFVVPADVSGDNLRRLAEPAGGGDPRHQAQFQFAPDFHSPYAQTWSVGIQRRIGFSQAFEIRYAGSRGMDLFQTRNGNPNARAYVEAGFADVLPPGTLPGDNASCAQCSGRVNPEFSQIALLANTAASSYHALQTRYNGRIGNQLVLGASYTWSRSIDNASDLLAASPGAQLVEQMSQNPFDLTRGERGPSDFDLTHIGSFHFVWDTPWFREQQSFTGRLLGGWKIAGVQRWTSGRPVSAYQQNSLTPTVNDRDFNQNFLGSFDTTRAFSANPNAPQSSAAVVLPNGALVDRRQPTRAVSAGDVRWIYNNLSSARLFGTPFGSGRNVMRAPGFNQTDLALYKNFRASERVTVQLRFESTNSFNHPNLGPGAVFIEQPGFLNPSETEAEPRRIAVGLRILF